MNGLNDHHKRHLWVAFRHVDRLLSDAARVLSGADSGSPFSEYVSDATPVQRRVFESYVRQLRELMAAGLARLGVAMEGRHVGAIKSALTSVLFAEITVEEAEPGGMRGYGPLSPEAASELTETCAELTSVLKQTKAYLSRGSGADLQARLARLERTGGETELLRELDRIITAHGLVELRPTLTVVVEEMESPSFEIAFFGRVSSGKSSLLNHILRRDVLPVGVTPITAVPTRVGYGAEARATIAFAESQKLAVPLSRLGEFATEEGNPGNRKHVSDIRVELPDERLRAGVTLVDTPGLGSLATSGAAESLAYLPRADLGIVLTDASAALGPEDVALVDALSQAGARAVVLVSKADLLTPEQRRRVAEYTHRQLMAQLGFEVSIHLVSVVGGEAALADRWFESELLPLFHAQRELRAASLRRKVGSLREAVVGVLRGRLERTAAPPLPDATVHQEEVRRALRRARALCGAARRSCEDLADLLPASGEAIIEKTATGIANAKPGAAAPGEHLAKVAGDCAAEVGARIATHLAETREQVARAIATAAAAAGAEPDVDDLPAPRGLPVMDTSSLAPAVRVRESALASITTGSRRRSLRSQLRTQATRALSDALSFHKRRLVEWAHEYLAELERALEARTGASQARLDLRPQGDTGGVADVQADLEALSRWDAETVAHR